tara:strand:+ start:1358 stop:1645 length:288 start_codon:yes stop_codon:yes gene_type:complete
MDQGKLKELLEFQINRNIINLYKSFLVTLEDIHDQHGNSFYKLKRALPENSDLISQADYWDEGRMDYLRKKVLDSGNDALREIMGQLDQFELTVK